MKITVAAIQSFMQSDRSKNISKMESLIREAKGMGAHVILPPELFEGFYFCREEKDEFFSWAREFKGDAMLASMSALSKELGVVIPVSFFEKEGHHYYNSLAMMDASGECLGVYRKSHIPDGPGYEEKFYFKPGNTGFKVWNTKFGKIGVGICWDQWFPETARAMMLQGAEVLLYPTAIGSEPTNPGLDTKDLWQRAMIGHSVSNVVPVIAANRIGNESGQIFYGSSFITNHRGDKVKELSRTEEAIIVHTLDLEEISRDRASFGFFRDRRPELYHDLVR